MGFSRWRVSIYGSWSYNYGHISNWTRPRLLRDLLPLHQQHHVDFALQPESLFRRHKRLIVFDADMTFIQCEIINEMSQLVGCEAEVKVLTEAAMRGELDFEEALRPGCAR